MCVCWGLSFDVLLASGAGGCRRRAFGFSVCGCWVLGAVLMFDVLSASVCVRAGDTVYSPHVLYSPQVTPPELVYTLLLGFVAKQQNQPANTDGM